MTPLLDAEGVFSGFLCAAMDISEQKRAEQEVLTAMRAGDTIPNSDGVRYGVPRNEGELRSPGNSEDILPISAGRSDESPLSDPVVARPATGDRDQVFTFHLCATASANLKTIDTVPTVGDFGQAPSL